MKQTTPLLPAPHEREVFMDALRGFAILGIFIANLNYLSLNFGNNSGPFHHAWDDEVSFLKKVFFEGKFYSIFSLLFGWGFALQYQKMTDSGLQHTGMLFRRLWGMLFLGLMHLVLLWFGDIVAFYALTALLCLYPVRNVAPKKLAIAGGVLILLPIVHYSAMKWIPAFRVPYEWLYKTGVGLDTRFEIDFSAPPVEQTKTWMQLWKINVSGFFFRYGGLYFESRIFKVLGMFYIGYALGKNYNYRQLLSNTALLKKIAVAGLIIGLPLNVLLAYQMKSNRAYENLEVAGLYQTIVYAFAVAPMALGYVALLALAWKQKIFNHILRVLQPVGKMAFSNYMLQSLGCALIFLGVGLGYAQQLGHLYQLLFGIVYFVLQIVFSHFWLYFFRFGPIEWVWRCLTYKRWVPMFRK